MALCITAECLNCGACASACPNHAVYAYGEAWSFADGTGLTGVMAYDGAWDDVHLQQEALSYARYFVVPEKCTECVGFFEEPQCITVCPLTCCVKDPRHEESPGELMAKKMRLHPA